MRYTTSQLGPLCTKLGSGVTPRGGEAVYVESGTALIRSQNVYNLQFSVDGLAHIDEEQARKMTGVTVESNDVLLNITGDSVARTCVVPDYALPARVNQHVAIIRPNAEKLDPFFLNYILVSPRMQSTLLSVAGSGGTRKALTKEMLEGLQVPTPDIEVQRRVVEILKNYDDLIEVNRRRIRLLEEAARLIYREWFVCLRFPGHEHTAVVDGVPEGWERKPIGELCEYCIGGGWGKDDPAASHNIPGYVIRGTDIPDIADGNYDRVPLRYHSESNFKSRALVPGDIILEVSNGNIRNIGRTYRVEEGLLKKLGEKTMCASFCKMIRPSSWQNSILLFAHLQEMQSSGIMDHFKTPSAAGINNFRFPALLSEAHILIPGVILFEDFIRQYEPLLAQHAALASCIDVLTRARNMLLPRLMSGEMEV